MSPVALATWHTYTPRQILTFDYYKYSERHLLEHDLVGTLDKVLPDGLSDLGIAVDEVISPEHVHGSYVVDGGELLGQASVTVKKLRMAAKSKVTLDKDNTGNTGK